MIWPNVGDPSESDNPALPAEKLGSGTPARKLFVKLKASPRSCSFWCSVRRKFLVTARSTCQKLGPGTLPRFIVLNVPRAGSANAVGSIQHAAVGWEQRVFAST